MHVDPNVMQQFVTYLEENLCHPSRDEAYRFTKAGPRSFLFRDERDTIFVKIGDDTMFIATDGENVLDHVEMLFLPFREVDEKVFDESLQKILEKF